MKGYGARLFAIGLCTAVLWGLTGCSQIESWKYRRAMSAIETEDYATAYTLLKDSADPRAAEELEKFAFVPVTITEKNSNDTALTQRFTYDDRGNLLSHNSSGKQWGDAVNERHEYTYYGYQMIAERYQSKDIAYGYTYTYDGFGNLVVRRRLDRNGDCIGQTVSTYDKQGNCLSEDSMVKDNAQDLQLQQDWIRHCTYDEHGRQLTKEVNFYYDGEEIEKQFTVYRYEKDGSYCEVYCVTCDGESRTYTNHYDSEGRLTRAQVQDGEEEPCQTDELRYNRRGDLEYHRVWYLDGEDRVTTYVYDDEGRLLERDTTGTDGEPTRMEHYTYDDRGNRLTFEELFCDTGEWSKIVYTYDKQDRLLREHHSSQRYVETTAYTYDEQGNVTEKRWEGDARNGSKTYRYDSWGNVVETFENSVHYETETTRIQTAQWELRYYPKGVPETVNEVINGQVLAE